MLGLSPSIKISISSKTGHSTLLLSTIDLNRHANKSDIQDYFLRLCLSLDMKQFVKQYSIV